MKIKLEKRAVGDASKKKAIILRDITLDVNLLNSPEQNIYFINCNANIKEIIVDEVYVSNSNLKIEKTTANEFYLLNNSNLKGDIESKIFVIEEGSVFNGSHLKYKK